MRRDAAALIGMVLTLVFILIGFFGSWYTLNFGGIDANYFLTKAEIGGMMTVNYGDIGSQMGDAKGIFDNMMYMTVIALIFAIIALIGVLGVIFNFGDLNTMSKVGGIFGILTFILALVAPLYFMTSAFLESYGDFSFWNEYGGPGYAWYLMIIAAIIALISSIPLFKKQAVKK